MHAIIKLSLRVLHYVWRSTVSVMHRWVYTHCCETFIINEEFMAAGALHVACEI